MMQSILLTGSGGGLTLIGAISGAGLSSGLSVCVDAGDFQSYSSASQQTWVNHISGGTNTAGFLLGAAATVSAGDPTFNGAIGYLPAYWSVNGSQGFCGHVVGQVIPDNPAADPSWAAFALIYRTTGPGILLSNASAGANGTRINLSGGVMLLSVQSIGALRLGVSGDTAVSAGQWHFVGVSVSEAMGASGGFLYLDGNYNQVGGANNFNATYSGTDAGAANQLAIGSDSLILSNTFASGSRIACLAIWLRAVAKSEFDTLRSLLRGRFGL